MCPYRRYSCDQQRVPRRRARVSSLYGFPDTAERVPAKYQKTGRFADVQERCVELGLTTHEAIRKNSLRFKCICMPGYIAYVLICVYAVNGARGFLPGFWQLLVILSVMNVIDRFLIDDWWVGHTKAWTILGTEDLKPYITGKDKARKWLFGTAGMAVISAILAGLMALLVR